MKNSKVQILVLSGNGAATISAINHLTKNNNYDFIIYEEKNFSPLKIISFLINKIKKKGIIWCIGFIYLNIKLLNKTKIIKNYIPDKYFNNFNNEIIFNQINFKPDWVLACGCSVLDKKFIKNIENITKNKFLNIHNGITPRYRGTGNKWAMHNGDFDQIGTTLHVLEQEIDTGEIVSNKIFDTKNLGFDTIDTVSLKLGISLFIEHINNSINNNINTHVQKNDQISSYYTFQNYYEHLISKRNLIRYQENHNIDLKWYQFFNSHSTVTKKMEKKFQIRDKIIKDLFMNYSTNKGKLLNIHTSQSMSKLNFNNFSHHNVNLFNYNLKTNASKYNIYNLSNFESKSVDFIILNGIFQFISNPAKASTELNRILKINGYIIITSLKQFSNFELLLMSFLLFTPFKKLYLRIFNKDYLNENLISNKLIPRRYEKNEFIRYFSQKNFTVLNYKNYLGYFKNMLFNQEFYLILRKKK